MNHSLGWCYGSVMISETSGNATYLTDEATCKDADTLSCNIYAFCGPLTEAEHLAAPVLVRVK